MPTDEPALEKRLYSDQLTMELVQALIERGLREDRLVAIENNPKLARLLRLRFPRAHIITGDACIWTFCCANTPNPLNPSARSFPACRC